MYAFVNSVFLLWHFEPGEDFSHLISFLLLKESFVFWINLNAWLDKTEQDSVLPLYICTCQPLSGNSVSIATELRAGRTVDRIPVGKIFSPVQTGPGIHPAPCTMGTGSFQGVKCGRGVLLTTHPLLVPRSWKSTAIPLHTLWATSGL